ncbi:MAG: S8 family peptidase, partial [Planctomycetaceae bacterium]
MAAAAASAGQGPTWGIQKLGIPELWSRGFRGAGVRIGHLDTGVDGSHPAFRKQAIAAFAEFDLWGNEVARPQVIDSQYHGTHTAGTLVGRPVNGFEFGIAPEASLYSARVIEGGRIIARVLGGLNWCLGQGVQIVNLSLGLRGYTPAFLTLIQALRNRGVLPVVAVGNEGPGTSRSPGNYDNVLSVGASDATNRVWVSSSSHKLARPTDPFVPDLVGPGRDVVSCLPGGGFQSLSGSSMATPHIAGLAALLWQAVPQATHLDIERAILDSCTRPAAMPQDRANRGLPNALVALRILAPHLAAKPGRATTRTKP